MKTAKEMFEELGYELNVGMYVRTKHNGIGKIIDYINDPTHYFIKCYKLDRDYVNCEEYITETDVLKASYNPIELLEVGDYVNGKKVIDKWEEPSGAFAGQIFIKLDGEDTVPTMRKIETIATKEQFEQIQYRIGDK